jgi:hypothetical protein
MHKQKKKNKTLIRIQEKKKRKAIMVKTNEAKFDTVSVIIVESL